LQFALKTRGENGKDAGAMSDHRETIRNRGGSCISAESWVLIKKFADHSGASSIFDGTKTGDV